MLDIIFVLKGIILTEVFTNAARSWEIFKGPRERIKENGFFRRLLDCFECSSVWSGIFVVCYLMYFEIPILTWALIFHRAACFIQIGYLNFDLSRALKEDDLYKKLGG